MKKMIHWAEIPKECFNPEAEIDRGVRYHHAECSQGKTDKSLVVTRTPEGFVFYCHRCNVWGIKSALTFSPGDALKWMQTYNEKPVTYKRKIELPHDFTHSIPANGLAWLYSNDIENDDIIKYCIGYSPILDRVILPVYEGDQLVYWQGRLLGVPRDGQPKYRNQFQAGRKDIYFKALDAGSKDIVLVEDILSAIKVGKVCDCYALLSVHISDELMFGLKQKYKTIRIWLDQDKWDKVLQYTQRYRSFGLNVVSVRTAKDPKLYTEKEIGRILCVFQG